MIKTDGKRISAITRHSFFLFQKSVFQGPKTIIKDFLFFLNLLKSCQVRQDFFLSAYPENLENTGAWILL